MRTTLFLLSLLLLSQIAMAGNDGGGGGVYVCGKTPELYDLYENRVLNGIPLISTKNMSEAEIENLIMDRLGQINFIYPQLLEKAFEFYDSYLEFTDDELPIVPDVADMKEPGCYKQLGIWKNKKLRVNRWLYSALDNLNKVAFKYHEAVYFIGRLNAIFLPEFSDDSRAANASLFHKNFRPKPFNLFPDFESQTTSLALTKIEKDVYSRENRIARDIYHLSYIPSKIGCISSPNYDLEITALDSSFTFNGIYGDFRAKGKKGESIVVENLFKVSAPFWNVQRNFTGALRFVGGVINRRFKDQRVTFKITNKVCGDTASLSLTIPDSKSSLIMVSDEINNFFYRMINTPYLLESPKRCKTKGCRCESNFCTDYHDDSTVWELLD